MSRNAARDLRRGGPRPVDGRNRWRMRPTMMALEERTLLSTFTVTSSADSAPAASPGVNTLRWAVEQANEATSASTIEFELGASPATITLAQGLLTLDNTAYSTTIYNGLGEGAVTISGNNVSAVVQVEADVTASVSGLTITGGSTIGNGGGLVNYGTITLTGCTVSGNSAGSLGGGLYNGSSGTATLINTIVTANSAYKGGGLYNNGGSATLTNDCTISGNSAGKYGGGLFNNGSAALLAVINSSISNNKASVLGAGLIDLDGSATLTNCTVSGNSAGVRGGGLYSHGTSVSLTLTTCTLSSNSAGNYGGGVFANGGTVTLSYCGISDNFAGDIAGGFSDVRGADTLTNCTVTGNSAAQRGGGVYSYDSSAALTLTTCTLSGNSASVYGGGLFTFGGTAALTNCTISGNSSAVGGGLINVFGADTLNNCTVTGNVAANLGGGLYSYDVSGSLSLTGCTVTANSAGESGGGISSVSSSITLTDGTVSGNSAGLSGGGLSNVGGTLTMTGTVVSGNYAGDLHTNGLGGGVYSHKGTYTATNTLTDCTISGNTVSNGGGGGLCVSDSTTILVDCTVSDNSVTGADGSGGGLQTTSGTTALYGCAISGNVVGFNGGGLANYSATLTLTNCTISGNSSGATGGGVGNTSYTDTKTTLTDCTVSGNSAVHGGGIDNDGSGTATLVDTIVAGNTASTGGSDVLGTLTSQGNNLIGETDGSSGWVSSDLTGTIAHPLDAMLAPLGNYGGPTTTMPLLPGSPAIGAGVAQSGVTTDQRGASRPTSGGIDIGAFQDEGYTVEVASGSPQGAPSGEAFGALLVAELTESFTGAPIPGVTIAFSAPSSGASAALGTGTAITNADGQASISATANATIGTYPVTASATGVASSASFELTNQFTSIFSGLTDQTITYGNTVTFTGMIAAGMEFPTGDVAVRVGGVTHDAVIGADGSFSAEFTEADVKLNASSTPYTVTYDYTSQGLFSAADGSSRLTVAPATLTVSVVGDPTNTYNGTVKGMLTSADFSLAGLVGDDTFTVTQSAGTYNSKDVTTAATITTALSASDFAPSPGTLMSNYIFPTSASGAGQITPVELTITAATETKIYDGTTSATATPTVAGLFTLAGDTVTGLSQAFNSKNVLGVADSTLVVTGFTVNDGDGGKDYTVATQSAAGTITPAPLAITPTSDLKVYDGTTASSLTPTYSGLFAVGGDSVTGLTQAFESKNVLGVGGSTLVVTGYTVNDGNAGKDYAVTTSSAAGTITPASLTITATTATKVYDGTTSATPTPTYTGLITVGGDTLTGLAEAFSSKNVLGADGSTLNVTSDTVNDGDGGNDYAVKTQSAAGTITPAPLTITATTDSKGYNGTASSTATPTATGLIPVGGDTLTGLAEAFGSKNVLGAGDSTLNVTSYTINDGDGGNDYAVTTHSAAGTITPAPLTITAASASRIYDGTTASTLIPTYSGLITVGGDTLTGLAEAFSSKNVLGAGDSTLNVTTYTVNDGDGGNDYTVTTRHATGTITPAPLTITATTDTKVYEATVSSTQVPTYTGLITLGGDTVTGLAQTFGTKNVLGAGDSTLIVTSYTVNDGDGGKDYAVTTPSAAGTITPVPLAITATSDTKMYDGTTSSTETPTYAGLITVGGDLVSGLEQTFSSKNVLGTGESALVVTSFTVDDGDGGKDYSVTTQGAIGTITPASLTITATSESKGYDGTTSATATPTVTGLITAGGDSLTGLAETFSAKHVLGAGDSTLSVTSYTVNDGDGGKDYTVTTENAAGTITPAPLIITANDQTMSAGAAVPQLTATYQILVGSDTSASLTTPVVLATTATSSSAAGVYPITASGASSPDYAISYRAGSLTISPTTVTLATSDGAAVYGQSVTFTATVSTTGTPSGTVAFYDGNTLLATVPLGGSGTALLSTTALSTGSHAITAIFKGTASILAEQSAPSSVTVAPTGTKVVVVQNPVFKKKKLTSVRLTAEIRPSAPGGGVPGGLVTFEILTKVKKKVKVTTLGSAALSSGSASLTLKATKVKGKAVTVIYSGDTNDTAATLLTPKVTA